jgi:hypothetical protein
MAPAPTRVGTLALTAQALRERGHRRLTLSPRRIISGQIDAARKTQMAALAKINPYKTTMVRLLFINGLPRSYPKPRRVCREERAARRGFAEPTEQLPIPIIPQAPHV